MNSGLPNKSAQPSAVILGGSYISLGAARCLAKRGVPVTLVDPELSLTYFSRSVHRRITSPPFEDEERCLEFLEQAAGDGELGEGVLIPSTNDGVKLLARHKQRLSRCYRVPLSEWAVTEQLYDKRLTHRLAQRQEVPIPDTHNPTDLRELENLQFEYPVILKPAMSTRFKAVTNKKAYRADNREELTTGYQTMAGIVDPAEILVQELIPGGADQLYSFFGYFKEGRLVSGHSAKRPRQMPMDFGMTSTLVVTEDIPELECRSVQLLSGIGYTGLAEVEFMYDTKDERFELIEVNPRLWGWNSLAIYSGVDLPYLVYADALHEQVDPGQFRDGVKWLHLATDLQLAAVEMWHGRLGAWNYLRSLKGGRDAVLSLSDPLPIFAELFFALRSFFKK